MNRSSQIRRYLLGELTLQERTELENCYLVEDDAFEELVACENDLIDSYARGILPDGERQQFEKQYCTSPERLARVEFAVALQQSGAGARDAAPVRRMGRCWRAIKDLFSGPGSFAWAAGAAAMILGLVCLWLWNENRTLRKDLSGAELALANERTRARAAQTNTAATEQPRQPEQIPNAAIALLTLTPGLSRSAEASAPTLLLSSNWSWVELQLKVSAEYSHYETEIQTAEGQIVYSVKSAQLKTVSNQRLVTIRIPATVLVPGDYVVKLTGLGHNAKAEELEPYGFRIDRTR